MSSRYNDQHKDTEHDKLAFMPWGLPCLQYCCVVVQAMSSFRDAQDRLLWKDKTCPART